jgi:hypothetical protein
MRSLFSIPLAATVFGAVVGAPARADVALFKIDPTQSSLTFSGSTAGAGGGTAASWGPQSPGSLTTSATGWIVVNKGAGFIEFLPGGATVLTQTNLAEPGIHGGADVAPADFAGEVTIGSGIAETRIFGAVRNLQWTTSSDTLSLDGGFFLSTFDASGVSFSTVAGAKPSLDYRENGLVVLAGFKDLGAQTLANTATNGQISSFPDAGQTMTLPVNASLPLPSPLPGGNSALNITGTIVAHGPGGLLITPPTLLQYPSAQTPGGFTLVWDSNATLQVATTLNPPDWTDAGVNPPTDITPSGPAQFFRAVR